MSGNSFGHSFRITTWGESHGEGIGVVIDGCPAGIKLKKRDIQKLLDARKPGLNKYTSPRKEPDQVSILSGIFEDTTTGAPITLFIKNKDADSSKYEELKNIYRPGHANYTYLKKYGIYDHRGGGRASGRETAARVAGGSVALKLLEGRGIHIHSYLYQVGNIQIQTNTDKLSEIFCPDLIASKKISKLIEKVKNEGDSIGGIVETIVEPMLPCLGEPVFDKLQARLSYAMLSIPATKGIEFGKGFELAHMKGSQSNDRFSHQGLNSNHSGGSLGGISTGAPLVFRVCFKPTSSIKRAQTTTNLEGKQVSFSLPKGSRHDPCIAIRGVIVVKAMTAITLADLLLRSHLSKIS